MVRPRSNPVNYNVHMYGPRLFVTPFVRSPGPPASSRLRLSHAKTQRPGGNSRRWRRIDAANFVSTFDLSGKKRRAIVLAYHSFTITRPITKCLLRLGPRPSSSGSLFGRADNQGVGAFGSHVPYIICGGGKGRYFSPKVPKPIGTRACTG